MIKKSLITICLAAGIALSTHADTIIEPFGLLSSNFNSFAGAPYEGEVGTAPGLSGVASAYGNQDTVNDNRYEYSFTPGVGGDADNYVGNGITQATLPDGGTGTYNVYVTWTASPATSGGFAYYAITHDSGTASAAFNQNLFGTNEWRLVGIVELTAGTTYTLTQVPGFNPASNQYSTKSAGVMFEPIPEPGTYAAIFGGLALAGALVYRRRIGAKK